MMIAHLLAGAVTGLTLLQAPDTTVSVSPGTRLSIESREGSIVIRTWDRDAVRVETDEFEEGRIEITRSGSTLRLQQARPWDSDLDLEVTVPEAMPITISAAFSDVDIQGTQASIEVETVEGDVTIRGGRGGVAVATVEGDVHVEDAEAAVAVSSGDGEIRILGATGTVAVDGIDGDIVLDRIDSETVAVSTVDGDIWYNGPIHDGGNYVLATHDGDIVCTVQEGANVTVSVATFDGDFRASFPIQLRGSIQKRFEFTLGRGSARLALEAFDGEILLIRPGERSPDDR